MGYKGNAFSSLWKTSGEFWGFVVSPFSIYCIYIGGDLGFFHGLLLDRVIVAISDYLRNRYPICGRHGSQMVILHT